MRISTVSTLVAVSLVLVACESNTGPTGPSGSGAMVSSSAQSRMATASSAASTVSSRMQQAGSRASVIAKTVLTKKSDAPRIGRYMAYSDGSIPTGEPVVLFFHASWCPSCKAADTNLTQWYGSEGFPLSVYKVDYDTHTTLRDQYGVTHQHTFVKIDGNGNVLKVVVGPTNAALQSLLES